MKNMLLINNIKLNRGRIHDVLQTRDAFKGWGGVSWEGGDPLVLKGEHNLPDPWTAPLVGFFIYFIGV